MNKLDQLLSWLDDEMAQRKRAVLSIAVADWETYCRVRAEYNQLDLVRQFVKNLTVPVQRHENIVVNPRKGTPE